MEDKPNGGIVGLVLAKMVCCVGILLFLSGALTLNGIAAWLFDGGRVWLVVTAALVVAGLFLLRRQKSSHSNSSKAPAEQIRADHPR